ncbi:MAG: VOC family protein [Gemmataceae bacterium]
MKDVPLRKIDHVHFFVGNARQSAFFYRNAFGFDVVSYAGLETKVKHEAGYVLRQGEITFVLTSPLSQNHPESPRLLKHGDGVMDIAFDVADVRTAFENAVSNGAVPVREPKAIVDDFGTYETATIHAYGDTTHTFVNRDRYHGAFAPGYKAIDPERYNEKTSKPVGLAAIDHIVGNVEEGKMDEWVEFYRKVLGFNQLVSFDDKDISTEYSALMSKVVQNGTGRIKFPQSEPAQAKRKSQIEEYPHLLRRPRRSAYCLDHGRHHRDRHGDVDNDARSCRTENVLRHTDRSRRSHQGKPNHAGGSRHSRRPGR